MCDAGGSAEVGGFATAQEAAIDALKSADWDKDEIRIVLRSPEEATEVPKT